MRKQEARNHLPGGKLMCHEKVQLVIARKGGREEGGKGWREEGRKAGKKEGRKEGRKKEEESKRERR